MPTGKPGVFTMRDGTTVELSIPGGEK
jgi:hypothetical protein